MSRWHSYLKNTQHILDTYNGRSPLHEWLKDYFRSNKQMGSTDRKIIAELVYDYFRLGHSALKVSLEESILAGYLLCAPSPQKLLESIKPEWVPICETLFEEKLRFVEENLAGFDPANIFPWKVALSEGINPLSFNNSFLQQPDLFLRVRPGKKEMVIGKLTGAGLSFRLISESAIALLNSTRINELVETDIDVVVQDLSSQKTGDRISLAFETLPPDPVVWDCCAGSGGKSLLAFDLRPQLRLTISDIRPQILENLNQRFRRAGIKEYVSMITDLTMQRPDIEEQSVDCIIADVPCTGSGTWARTPEQLHFFAEERINYYHELQKKILTNAIPVLKPGGLFVYITCSVFSAENEEIVRFARKSLGLHLVKMDTINGYHLRADTMFAAVLRK